MFLPEQRLDLATALSASTAGSAWVNGLEGESGSIAVGLAADFALLDRDPFAGDPRAIGDTRVLGTWIGGERVHTAADAPA